MSTSDFLMILSIFVALVAITVANDKKLWLYKFSSCSVFGGLAIIIIINVLIFYYDLRARGMCPIFEYEKGIRADYWGYFLSVFLIVGIIYYVGWSRFFPKQNADKIILYYQQLIHSNPTLLIGHIERYHLDNIYKIVCSYNEKQEDDDTEDIEVDRNSTKKWHLQTIGWKLAIRVWQDIILNKEFIRQSVTANPLFFLQIIAKYHGNGIPNGKELIQYYFRELIKSKNQDFIRELIEFSNHVDEPVLKQAQQMSFCSHIFQKEHLWVTKHEIVLAIGEEARKEVDTEWQSFAETENGWHNQQYRQTVCYQCLLLYELQCKYLSDFVSEHSINVEVILGLHQQNREIMPYFHVLADICSEMQKQQLNIANGSYADKYINDCRETIYNLLGYFVNNDKQAYISPLIMTNLGISKCVKTDNNYFYSTDAIIEVMEQYIKLCSDYPTNSQSNRKYLAYLKKERIRMPQWDEALAGVDEFYQEKPAYQHLKTIDGNSLNINNLK